MHIFLNIFISIPYMFRAAMCPSSGELIVSMPHLVYVTLCIWPSGMQVGTTCIPDGHLCHSVYMTVWYAGRNDLHTRRSSTQSDIYQVRHWYN